MWVEYRSNDMEWKVGVVNRVIKQPPEGWDYDVEETDPPESQMTISYNVGVEGVVSYDNIRAPRAGLQHIFGKRPWLLQQFILLQLERRLRFDESHEYDFEELDTLKFASARYDLWLKASKNIDFKAHYDKQPRISQRLLKTHLLGPFDLMDSIIENKKEWNFNDPDISVYTYMGILGSGAVSVALILLIQIIAPVVLFYNNLYQSDGVPSKRFFLDEDGNSLNGEFLPSTTFDQFCEPDNEPGLMEGKILGALVLVIYFTSVIPDTFLDLFKVSGGAESTYSKINSLRNTVWKQNDDEFMQEIGFKLDRMLNTGYISLIYILMVFVLINTPIVLDIILNALAIEFIHRIDEKMADAEWWDGKNRWIRAGTIELVIQGTLTLRVLESPSLLCKRYDIDKERYHRALGGMKSISNKTIAKRDASAECFMTNIERSYEEVARKAEAAGDTFVLAEYRKTPTYFSFSGSFLNKLGFGNSIFQRYDRFKTWSMWDKILFLPRVPSGIKDAKDLDATDMDAILGESDLKSFLRHVAAVLTAYETYDSCRKAIKHRYYWQVPGKFLIGMLEIVFYWLVLLFPVFILAAIFLVPFCY